MDDHDRRDLHYRSLVGEIKHVYGEDVLKVTPFGVVIKKLCDDKILIPWHRIEELHFSGQDDIVDGA